MSDEQQSFPNVPHLNAFNVLRKLQNNIRSNIPAMIAQRAMSSFSLQQEPPPANASQVVFVVVYTQNPFAGQPEVREIHAQDIQKGLINSRVQINDSRGVLAMPDDEGNYLYWPGNPEFDQVNAFYYATFTLKMFERYASRQIPWSFPATRITVDPYVGNLANAFYNEQEQLLGFHAFNTNNGELHSTAQSADIVSHETAHAVLDGLRDLYNESFGLGARSFHESFGDMAAILVGLHDDSLIRRLLEWTKGDLKMSTFITEVAEHLTDELLHNQHFSHHTVYLRNAFNTLKAVPFDDLLFETDNPDTQLTREEHNYSRLFTGAFYDILVGVYERFKEHNMPDYVALYRARDVVGQILVAAIESGPLGELTFADMAKAFLATESILYNRKYYAILRYVFDKRGILSRDETDAYYKSLSDLPDIRLPEAINNSLAASIFLERELLPKLNIKPGEELYPLNTYRNAAGYAYMNYFCSRTITLEGEQYKEYNGVTVDIFGGLTLMFDKHNQLRNVCNRPVNDEDVRQIKIIISELIEYDRIAMHLYPSGISLQPNPDALLIPGVPYDKPEGNKLVKYPSIFDEIPNVISNFKDYLESQDTESDS
jgi:hypothetical protein